MKAQAKGACRILKTVREIEYDEIPNNSLIGQVYCEWYVRDSPSCSFAYESSAYFYPIVVEVDRLTDTGNPQPTPSEMRQLTRRLEKTLKFWRAKPELHAQDLDLPAVFIRVVAEIIVKANDEVDKIACFFDKTYRHEKD